MPVEGDPARQPNPPAWECVAVKTGTMNGPVGSGLNERILCAPPNPASNCNGHFEERRPAPAPTAIGYSDGDPRILAFFLVPYGSLDLSGSGESVPIANFAYYVTGWHSKGGEFDNPCDEPRASIPDVFAPGTDPNDSGVVSGYFIKHVAPNLGGGVIPRPGDQPGCRRHDEVRSTAWKQ